jgi:hypothetical protein
VLGQGPNGWVDLDEGLFVSSCKPCEGLAGRRYPWAEWGGEVEVTAADCKKVKCPAPVLPGLGVWVSLEWPVEWRVFDRGWSVYFSIAEFVEAEAACSGHIADGGYVEPDIRSIQFA